MRKTRYSPLTIALFLPHLTVPTKKEMNAKARIPPGENRSSHLPVRLAVYYIYIYKATEIASLLLKTEMRHCSLQSRSECLKLWFSARLTCNHCLSSRASFLRNSHICSFLSTNSIYSKLLWTGTQGDILLHTLNNLSISSARKNDP